ncbi:MAG: DUF5683 domain-containing protein [Bacteroidales bacterium]|nr:DUF5683 domain-containing protein [Bacteroidales bacterium]
MRSGFIQFLFLLSLFAVSFAKAQTLTLPDSIPTKIALHSPKKAAIYSAVLPGLGQVYNQKYWKIPIVYAGLGGSAYFFYANNKEYQVFRKELQARFLNETENLNPKFANYSESNLVSLKNYYQRNRELSILVAVVVYALNILDASVDAHLFSFDVSDDLSFSIQPFTSPQMNPFSDYKTAYTSGISLHLKF